MVRKPDVSPLFSNSSSTRCAAYSGRISRTPSLVVLCSKKKKHQKKTKPQAKKRGLKTNPNEVWQPRSSSYAAPAGGAFPWDGASGLERVIKARAGGMAKKVEQILSRLLDSRVPPFHDEFREAVGDSGLGCVATGRNYQQPPCLEAVAK